MPARYLTGAQLGRLVGVTRGAVADAKRKGTISPNREGLYDIMDTNIEQWIQKRPYQRTAAAHKRDREATPEPSSPAASSTVESTAESPQSPPPSRAAAAQDGELEERKANARYRSSRGSTRGDPSYAESERKLKAYQAMYWETRAKEKRGDYIARHVVELFIQKLWSIDSSMFLTRGDRIADQLAAIARSASSDGEAALKINNELTKDAYREQASKKREMSDFLKQIKSEQRLDEDDEYDDEDHEEAAK
jgi:hypothetical protein